MVDKEFLMIPGPTPLPPRVMAAMTHPMVNHRGILFKKLFGESRDILKKMLNISGDVFLIPSSGTGAMELAVQNFTHRGERVLVVDTGFFGERFYKINVAFGRDAIHLEIPWGKGAKPEAVKEAVRNDPTIKAVFLTQNETSSTVLNNIREISSAIREISDAFIIVDAVSSIGIAEIDMDNWGIDVVAAASQKGLMSPPGIGIVAVNRRAVDFALSSDNDSYYFNLKDLKKNADLGQPFTTFPVADFFGFREGLNILLEEGFENAYKRHEAYRTLVRDALKELNLKFVADDAVASPAVTGIYAPEGVNADEIVNMMRKYSVEIASGQGILKGKAFRIGHMGFINSNDLLVTVGALECVLKDLKYEFELGSAVKKLLSVRRSLNV